MMKHWFRSWVVVGCLSGVALAPWEADAALNAYLKLKGQKQGEIKGSVVEKGREGKIMVIAVSHEITSPRDAATGLAMGKRMHKPIVITKEIDRSTPVLYKVLTSNEVLAEFQLDVYGTTPKNLETVLYSVRLTNANIASIRLVQGQDGKLMQEIAFTYQRIEWTWTDGGITAMDDWEAPVSK